MTARDQQIGSKMVAAAQDRGPIGRAAGACFSTLVLFQPPSAGAAGVSA